MILSEAERKMYYLAIKKLIFSPCISQTDFIGMIIEQELGVDEYDKLLKLTTNVDKYGYGGSYSYEYNRVSKQCKRLLSYLVTDEISVKSISQMLKASKKYDNIMRLHQIELYNSITTELNESKTVGLHFPLIESTCIEPYALELLKQDDTEKNREMLGNAYPYLCFEERKGLNFIECIFLVNVILVHHQKRLNQLEELTARKASRDKAIRWVQLVEENMYSTDIRRLYIDIFFDILYDSSVGLHNTEAEEYAKMAWLPEKYINRKDILNASEKHGVWLGDEIYTKGGWWQQDSLDEKMEITNCVRFMLDDVIPLSWNSMIQGYKTSKELAREFSENEQQVDDNVKAFVNSCVCIVEKFIRESVDVTKTMMMDFLIPQ